jgi:hypothetical protein
MAAPDPNPLLDPLENSAGRHNITQKKKITTHQKANKQKNKNK